MNKVIFTSVKEAVITVQEIQQVKGATMQKMKAPYHICVTDYT